MRYASARFLVAAVFVLGVSGAPAEPPGDESSAGERHADDESGREREETRASEPARGAKDDSGEGEGDPVVITNSDLERMFGPASAGEESGAGDRPEPAGEQPEATAPDALKALERQKQLRQERRKQIAEAREEVAEAEARVRDLERRLLAVSNPFLARPDVAPEEREEWEGKNSVERRKMTQEQLEEARKRLDEARAALRRLGSGN